MSGLDRLSGILRHVEVYSQQTIDEKESNLFILGESDEPEKLILWPDPEVKEDIPDTLLAHAKVDFGGKGNFFQQVMPGCVDIDITFESEIRDIALLIIKEVRRARCGGQFALGRLCDLLVVALLRYNIEKDDANLGILAGLAHPKLRHVVVAIHDCPGRQWRVEDFAELAGMSRSQFMQVFQNTLGVSPMAYLKQWRMAAAHSAIRRGERVNGVATRLGYRSTDAFSRSFAKTYGILPSQLIREFAATFTE